MDIHSLDQFSMDLISCDTIVSKRRTTMIYVMSDLHGCYDKYIAMLKKINLKNDDTLYILGDVIDRGLDGIKILLDMMTHHNIVPLLGNHEYMAYKVLSKLNVEITEDNYDKQIDKKTMDIFQDWLFNGGYETQKAFTMLNHVKRKRVLEYLEEFLLYEIIEVNGRKFVLVHAGFDHFSPDKDFEEYDINDMLWARCDYDKVYFEDMILVTGHTPTFTIDEEHNGKILIKNNHINVDCGAVFDRKLGCICLDTMEEIYV